MAKPQNVFLAFWLDDCTCTCLHKHLSRSQWPLDRHGRCNPLPPFLFSASLTESQNFNPLHSAILFSQRFFCRSLLLPPCTFPCKIVLASPDDLDTCPNHFTLRFFTLLNISSLGSMACLILSLTASLVMWSLYEMPSSFLKISSQWPAISSGCPLSMSRFRRRTIVRR